MNEDQFDLLQAVADSVRQQQRADLAEYGVLLKKATGSPDDADRLQRLMQSLGKSPADAAGDAKVVMQVGTLQRQADQTSTLQTKLAEAQKTVAAKRFAWDEAQAAEQEADEASLAANAAYEVVQHAIRKCDDAQRNLNGLKAANAELFGMIVAGDDAEQPAIAASA